jgi:hypothetical protein
VGFSQEDTEGDQRKSGQALNRQQQEEDLASEVIRIGTWQGRVAKPLQVRPIKGLGQIIAHGLSVKRFADPVKKDLRPPVIFTADWPSTNFAEKDVATNAGFNYFHRSVSPKQKTVILPRF